MTKRSLEIASHLGRGIAQYTRSKKPRLNPGLSLAAKKFPWISATKTYNYMNDDPIVDYLEAGWRTRRERSHSNDGAPPENFTEFIRLRGMEFEDKIVDYINQNVSPVTKVANHYSLDGVEKTKILLSKGVPILHSAPLCHRVSKTYGIADLIVRSDFLHKISPNLEQSSEELQHGCRFSDKYHYVVIDIKYSTLPLNHKGRNLLNQGSMQAYKCQIWVYNRALGAIQGYTSPFGYILGRRWKFTKYGVTNRNYNCFDRLGIVEFKDYDKKIIVKSRKALKWARLVKKEGVKWKLDPPSREELYPNMCRNNGKWNSTKQRIADRLGEITQIWMCGMRTRKIAFSKGIRSWYDPRASSQAFEITGVRGEIIDKMLKINRQGESNVLPARLMSSEWRDDSNDVYVDFETFSDILSPLSNIPSQPSMNLIYHIGVGYKSNGSWKYKYFIAHKPTLEEEYRIMKEFVELLKERSHPKIYYWHAEKSFWRNSCNNQYKRADLSLPEKEDIVYWDISNQLRDLRKLFIDEQIVVKNCFGYGLKSIGKALKKLGLINTKLESECNNGQTAMIQAWRCYSKFEKPWSCGAMKDVTQYNEYDCRLLYDIIYYLRKNH